MGTIKVGVLRGGPSSEYEVSLKTGAAVLEHMPRQKYDARDILLTKEGKWYLDGYPIKPERLNSAVDVVFNALHGEFGEDGGAQKMFDLLSIPYTGSGHFASALGMNKPLVKDRLKSAGIKIPFGAFFESVSDHAVEAERIAYDAFQKISPPWIVKPAHLGSSVGLALARSFSELVTAVKYCLQFSKAVLVEEFVRGREGTCGSIDRFRGQDVYATLPVEIVLPADKQLFDYEAKYSGLTREICPGSFSRSEKEAIADIAVKVHKLLGLRHYARTDFIVSPRGVYVLEVNTLPGLTGESLVPKALKAAGVELPEFLDHVISLAFAK